MKVLKSVDLSGMTDVRERTRALQLRKQELQPSGVIVNLPPSPGGGTTIINNFGLQFANDFLYGALLNQGLGWARDRLSFQPNTSTGPLVIDTQATKRIFPFVVLDYIHGYVMTDGQATPHFWQLSMSTDGIPFCADKGTVSANPLLNLT